MSYRKSVLLTVIAVLLYFVTTLAFTGGQTGTPAAQKIQKIEIWQIHSPLQDLMAAFDEATAKFEESNPNIDVELVRTPTEDFHTKLVTTISAGRYPDMVIWNIQPGIEFSEKGIVHDSQDIVGEVGEKNFSAAMLQMYQVPLGKYQWEVPLFARLMGLHYRKDWLSAAGMNPAPVKDSKGNLYVEAYETWQDVLDTSVKLTLDTNGDGKPDRWGAGFQYNRKGFGDSANYAFNVLTTFGGYFLEAKEPRKVAINSPKAVAAFKFMKDFYFSGAMPEGVTAWDGYANNMYFENGTVGLVENSNSIIPNLVKENPDMVDKVGVATVPYQKGVGQRRKSGTPDTITVFETAGVEATKKFAVYLLEKDTQVQMFSRMGVGYYGPLRQDVLDDPFFAQIGEQERMFMENNKYLVGIGWPGSPDPRLNAAWNSFILDDALSRISVDDWSAEQTVQEMEKKLIDIMQD
jgi:ABC-type glycerol-3-phosphate transport system substrate-binding protein